MQGFTRLQKLGMCMSRKSTNRKIKEAAQHFQKKIKSWKAVVERRKNTPTSEVLMPTQKEIQVSCKLNFVECLYIVVNPLVHKGSPFDE